MKQRCGMWLTAACVVILLPGVVRADAPPTGAIAVPAQAQAILPLNEVRVGQKGYGLTVFHGTRIEPFPVEVISVQSDFEPKRGVIWIVCDDPRLAVSGPVQGMSGSPIYLWDEGEPTVPGEGGRLIGAFAYGFSLVKICLAGVQPIELMREVSDRAVLAKPDQPAQVGMGGPHAGRTLRALREAIPQSVPKSARWQLDEISRLFEAMPGGEAPAEAAAPPTGPAVDGQVTPMFLPIHVGAGMPTHLLAPMLSQVGLTPMAAPAGATTLAGRPPLGLDPEAAKLAPGSVLSVPLGWGDMDLSAAGTVTDVLPDGRVLGFGHAMFGEGDIGVPMATGFVHTIVPLITTSFKLSGSLRLAGGLVRDENSAVVGTREGSFTTAPVQVRLRYAGREARTYQYTVVNHRMLTPILTAIVTMQSIMAEQQLPAEHTLTLNGTLDFAGGRSFHLRNVGAGTGLETVIYQMLPPVSAMMQNPFEMVALEKADITIDIEPRLRIAMIAEARIDRVEVAPGDVLDIHVRMQPFGGEAVTRRIALPIPQDLADGEYPLMICDGTTYASRVLSARPHRMVVRNLDELQSSVQQILDSDPTAIYAMLQLPEQGLAHGRTELPRLPSSRRALVQSPTTTAVTPYAQWAFSRIEMDSVTTGEVGFTLTVRRPFKTR